MMDVQKELWESGSDFLELPSPLFGVRTNNEKSCIIFCGPELKGLDSGRLKRVYLILLRERDGMWTLQHHLQESCQF